MTRPPFSTKYTPRMPASLTTALAATSVTGSDDILTRLVRLAGVRLVVVRFSDGRRKNRKSFCAITSVAPLGLITSIRASLARVSGTSTSKCVSETI